jgi:stage V sporulation protein G
MPSRKRKDGTFKDVVHPLNAEMRETIEKEVIAAFDHAEKTGQMGSPEEY